jgi:phosphatidylglycerol:prolipoprotein diacylglycerol transferase
MPLELSELWQGQSYFLHLSLLYCLLFVWVFYRAKNRHMYVDRALTIGAILVVTGFIGARLLHVLYEAPEYYRQNPGDIYRFWLGGFVFYGGLLTAVLSASLYLHWKRESFGFWADFFAPVAALGYGLGRGACFWAGCCYGKVCELPWAIDGRHPTQLYAMGYELLVAVYLSRAKNLKYSGDLFVQWIILHSLGRLALESLRDDFRGAPIMGLTISSWLSLLLFSLASAYFVSRKLRPEAIITADPD